MNITFTEITKDCLHVLRAGEETPVAVMFRYQRNWELVGDGKILTGGRFSAVKKFAIERYCTCGECPNGR